MSDKSETTAEVVVRGGDVVKLTPLEQAMTWERMSGERLSDAERKHVLDSGEFIPPHLRKADRQPAVPPETELQFWERRLREAEANGNLPAVKDCEGEIRRIKR